MRTLTLTGTVMLISQTKLGGELLPERPYPHLCAVFCSIDTIRDDIITYAQKMTKSQINLAHIQKEMGSKEKLKKNY